MLVKSNFSIKVAVANCGGAMEADTISKNGQSPKSLMSRANTIKILLLIAVSAMFFSCNKGDINSNGNSNILQDTIFYNGTDNATTITFQNDDGTYSVQAFEGKVVVYFNDGIDLAAAQKTISALGGTIIEQVPTIGYYYVEVGAGNENTFINAIKDKNVEFVTLSLVCELYSAQTIILDHFDNYKPGTTHGDMVKSVFDNCAGASLKSYPINVMQDFGVNGSNPFGMLREPIYQMTEIRKLTNDDLLCNMSFGPTNDLKLSWNKMTVPQQNNDVISRQIFIKTLVQHLEKLGNGKSPNIVVTCAAGNVDMPDYYTRVILPMIYTGKPKRPSANNTDLNSIETDILTKNILIVTSTENSTIKSDTYGDVAQVNIKGETYGYEADGKTPKQLSGSSFAAPEALCKIRQIMEIKKISAVDALAIVKKSVANPDNGGMLLDNVDDIINPQPQRPIVLANTTWDINAVGLGSMGTITFNSDGTCYQIWTPAEEEGIFNGSYNILTNNNVTFEVSGYGAKLTYNGKINGNTITGSVTMVGGEGGETFNFTATKK